MDTQKPPLILLQERIDNLIGSMGTERLIELLGSFSTDGDITSRVSAFISLTSAYYFSINISELYAEGRPITSVKSCRMICYKLHKDVLEMSIRKIGKHYNRTENPVMKAIHRVEEIITDPKLDPIAHKAFLSINSTVRKYIITIKQNEEQKKAS